MAETSESAGLKVVPIVIMALILLFFFLFVVGGRLSQMAHDVGDTSILIRFDSDGLVLTSTEDMELDRVKINMKFADDLEESVILPDETLAAYDLYPYLYPDGEMSYVVVYYYVNTRGDRYEWRPIQLWNYEDFEEPST